LASFGASASPAGISGTPVMVPAATPSVTAFSQSAWAGSTTCGAVGPTGLPKTQLMPIRIRLTPITRMIEPVTTGGKKRRSFDIRGASSMAITPAAMIAPKMARAPSGPPLALAITCIGWTAAKVTPIITGSRTPNHWVAPRLWIRVTMPQVKRSAEIRKATSAGSSFSARPMISGTAMAPAYMTRTCWRPSVKSFGAGNSSSTGCVASLMWCPFPRGPVVRAVSAPPRGSRSGQYARRQAGSSRTTRQGAS